VILQVRKVLGSSTFAVARYLEALIERLRSRKPANLAMTDDSPLVARLAAVTAAHGLAASAPLAESSRFAAAGNNFRDNKDKLAVLRAQQATADTLAQAAGMRVVLSELRSIHLLHEQEQHITMQQQTHHTRLYAAAAAGDGGDGGGSCSVPPDGSSSAVRVSAQRKRSGDRCRWHTAIP